MLFVLLGLCVAATETANACGPITSRAKLKGMFVASTKAASGLQEVVLGPLTDGRTIRFAIEYLLDYKGTRVVKTAAGMTCVTFDRRDAAIAGLAIDASILCQQHGLCEKFPAYVKSLWDGVDDVRDLKLFETSERRLKKRLSRWCMKAPEAAAWLAAFESFIPTVQWHEAGHIVLGHLSSARRTEAAPRSKFEAEADGFAAYMMYRVLGYTTDAGAVLALEALGHSGKRPSSCRAEAFGMGLKPWLRKYFAGSSLIRRLPPPAAAKRDRLRGSRFRFSKAYDGRISVARGDCQRYARHFRDGLEKALELIGPRTRMRVNEKWGGTCNG